MTVLKRIIMILIVVMALAVVTVFAAQPEALRTEDVRVIIGEDAFGQQRYTAEGTLHNDGAAAYTDILMTAALYNDDDEQIGEGIGFLVNACGAGLLPDFALQPGSAQRFVIDLERYEQDAQIDRVEVITDATAITADNPARRRQERQMAADGITRIYNGEVVTVEWLDSAALRFGVGCVDDLFNQLDWYQHSTRTDITRPVVHPSADDIGDDLLERLRLTDPILFDESHLYFAPGGRRLVYQGERNEFWTAEPDGRLPRLLYTVVYNRTLKDVYWLPLQYRNRDDLERENRIDDRRYIAYYYGAFGDPVLYFTADEEGRVISRAPINVFPSVILPGASPDGLRVVIAGTFAVDGEEVTGYFVQRASNNSAPELLFAAEPPGNNYPPPLYRVDDTGNEAIYVARPVADPDDADTVTNRLQCYNRQTETLHDLATLPVNLNTDERSLWWLSPDGASAALAANGVNGGLWWVDLSRYDQCGTTVGA